MDERHRVLIADSYPDEAEQLKKELSGKYNVISVRDNGVDTLDDIIKLKPDLVVIDLMLSEIDGIGVIEKCRELIEPDKIPAFIALTMLENRDLMECIRRLKVDYCMMKPFQAGILAERISQMIRIRSVNNDIQKNEKALHGRSKRMCSMCGTNDVRRQISFLVRNLGVPAHIKGCRYMKYAILMAIEDCNRINYITKLLYPEIAKKCKTTTSSVERAIRHAIDIVWIKGNQELLKEIFGTTVICDRYIWDTYIDFKLKYPEYDFEHGFWWRLTLKTMVKPNPSIVMFIPAEESMRRSGLKDEPFPEPIDVRQKRIEMYYSLAGKNVWQWSIEATNTIDKVFDDIRKACI